MPAVVLAQNLLICWLSVEQMSISRKVCGVSKVKSHGLKPRGTFVNPPHNNLRTYCIVY